MKEGFAYAGSFFISGILCDAPGIPNIPNIPNSSSSLNSRLSGGCESLKRQPRKARLLL
ncbi:MAG: hypothetical protein MR440_04770 [Firmicutes bacterium]|nr:hypothetical protein [Bacillota bacterium]